MAESIAPAPKPYGIAQRHSIQNFVEAEKPNNAAAVRKTLVIVTSSVLVFFVILSDIRLDIMVPPDTIMEMIPAAEVGI